MKALAAHVDKTIKDAGTKDLSRHLRYLSEIAVGSALFDDQVSTKLKKATVCRMRETEGEHELDSPRFYASSDEVRSKELPDFFTKST